MNAQMILTVGGPGSGKSTVIRKLYPATQLVDMDAIKATHPEYDPKNPSAVHAWSQQLAVREAFARIGRGETFVFDSTGTNVERLLTFIAAAKAAGMETVAVLVSCSLETAIARNAKRARTVPVDMLREKHAAVASAWQSVRALVDVARVVMNEDGEPLEV